MNKFFIIFFFLISLLFISKSKAEDLSAQQILATSKIAGACGILDLMINFQKTTKMEGGDEFVARFWNTEAARLGQTVQELSDSCDKAIVLYDQLFQAAETKNNVPC